MKRCAICRRPVTPRAENPNWPFCSERCRLLDLGRWMTGDYVISSPAPEGEAPDRGDGEDTDRDDDGATRH